MKRASIAVALGLLAQSSWAITIDFVGGTIYGEVGTTHEGGRSQTKSGNPVSQGLSLPAAYMDGNGVGAYAYVQGNRVEMPSTSTGFILSTTAQSKEDPGDVSPPPISTYASVRSGATSLLMAGADPLTPTEADMMEFVLNPEAGESFDQVAELSVHTTLAGILSSTGYPDWGFAAGVASVDFVFQVYVDPDAAAVASFTYSDSLQKETNITIMDSETSTPLPLPDGVLLSDTGDVEATYSDGLVVGDHIWVYFEQLVMADTSALYSAAKAAAVGFTSDGSTTSAQISAHVVDGAVGAESMTVPEPATVLLIGVGLLGLPFCARKKAGASI